MKTKNVFTWRYIYIEFRGCVSVAVVDAMRRHHAWASEHVYDNCDLVASYKNVANVSQNTYIHTINMYTYIFVYSYGIYNYTRVVCVCAKKKIRISSKNMFLYLLKNPPSRHSIIAIRLNNIIIVFAHFIFYVHSVQFRNLTE